MGSRPREALKVNIVVPGLHTDHFTAGILVIAQVANGLVEHGHEVKIVAGSVAFEPAWIELKAEIVEPSRPLTPAALAPDAARVAANWVRVRTGRGGDRGPQPAMASLLARLGPYAESLPLQRGAAYEKLRRSIPPGADVTVATSWDTVVPVYLYGSGARVHLMQHYEVWHADDYEEPALAAAEADLGYRLPFGRIAVVTWLRDLVREEYGQDGEVCWPGIDHDAFKVVDAPPDEPFTVLTSGGRDRRWKGFLEGAEAIREARETIPDLRWRVYGGAALPPDNDIAPYEDLGFVQQGDLPRLYSTSHVTLLPSWYETFSYPALESMACGSVLVATEFAAQDLARDGENAIVVPDRDSSAMAGALVDLWRDPGRRAALRERGLEDARGFTWERAKRRMTDLIEAIAASPPPPPPARHGRAPGDIPSGTR